MNSTNVGLMIRHESYWELLRLLYEKKFYADSDSYTAIYRKPGAFDASKIPSKGIPIRRSMSCSDCDLYGCVAAVKFYGIRWN